MELNAAHRLLGESYPGNLGMMEMVKFYKVATPQQKQAMKSHLDKKQYDQAWELVQQTTGVKLQ
jgi:hypothetical protein